ncbi:Hachiman antiphage defense system protein HamA [Massilia sp. BJB1822]|uniref:Hachiman antiphage defense system protein HamA n=1 Tax=Massilia sp. BJB1822 TaxID=2744470 RepID=UPI001594681C|nr:Hachiman antiphage defense system protein HamA [Massilia sp. BJB1822]NVD97937.1 DUF1837 domain-containing protein [Massilia sp. BJB1822]
MSSPAYLKLLTNTGKVLLTDDGQSIPIWELAVPPCDDACLKDWARRFRQNYCLDSDIDALRDGTGLTRSQYLLDFAFPDGKVAPGPSIRAGDFAELLISDYVEHILGYWVPRGKYSEKESRNESAKGVDILGFKVVSLGKAHPSDELLTFEVKAQLSETTYNAKLQEAIDHSDKDYLRAAISLNATKRRFIKGDDDEKISLIARFQNKDDRPFIYKSGAAAMLSAAAFDETKLKSSTVSNHVNKENLQLVVVKGSGLMALAHAIYERAANEA